MYVHCIYTYVYVCVYESLYVHIYIYIIYTYIYYACALPLSLSLLCIHMYISRALDSCAKMISQMQPRCRNASRSIYKLRAGQAIGRQCLGLLETTYGPCLGKLDLQITVEVADMQQATYFKIPAGTLGPVQ